jgi:cyanophycinase|tara:strand:+ start:25994 stop:26875 length:882 start_codon:yes stop_codon:yes gene_type:complete
MPTGKLISIGGNEFKFQDEDHDVVVDRLEKDFFELGILERFVSESGGVDAHIEVITTASSIPLEVGEAYAHAFERIGCNFVGFLHIRDRKDALRPDFIERVKQAKGVMMTGGNQYRLTTIFGGTEILKILKQRYESDGLIIAGTSAGAMAMSGTMIYQGSSKKALLKGEVKITTGFGLMDNVIIDSHFVTRGRFGRLTQAVASNPSCIGIGLGEDTGILVADGDNFEVIGSGLVLIFDGHEIKHNNISDLPEGTPISIEHMIVHALAKGDKYQVSTRKFEAAVWTGELEDSKD